VKLRAALRTLLLIAGALACIATPAPRSERNYPAWELSGRLAGRTSPCAELELWVSKSGKQGLGVTLAAKGVSPTPCAIKVSGAQFQVGGAWISAEPAPAPVEVLYGEQAQIYLPFPFDNEAKWNQGVRTGTLLLALNVGGETQADWLLPMEHLLRGFHRDRTQ
jgi:hypothetical protein